MPILEMYKMPILELYKMPVEMWKMQILEMFRVLTSKTSKIENVGSKLVWMDQSGIQDRQYYQNFVRNPVGYLPDPKNTHHFLDPAGFGV